MGRRGHPPEKRSEAIAALEASRRQGGDRAPNFKRVARQLGWISATSLRSWWRAHQAQGASPVLELHPGGRATPGPPRLSAEELFDLDEPDFLKRLATDLAAKTWDSDIAAMQALKLQRELYARYQEVRPREAGDVELDEAEYVTRVEQEAADLPEAYLELFVQEYLRRNPRARLVLSADREG